jgi:GTPase SAR1 family protein
MLDLDRDFTIPTLKVTVIGTSGCGKTSIINRVVNHSFSSIYEPSYESTNFSVLLKIGEEEGKDVQFVNVIFEDVFGLNNPLLQTSEDAIKSSKLIDKRKKMVQEFKNIMFTSLKKGSSNDGRSSKETKNEPQ